MSLELAIEQLQAEIDMLDVPHLRHRDGIGTAPWFMLRAKSTALSMLKAAQKRRMIDPSSFEQYRRKARKHFAVELGEEQEA